MSLVALRNVSFSYDGAPVLIDVDLAIEEGDFLAIIGPNGSGKTTLVKIILGLLRPTAGQVEIFGCAPAQFAARDEIGYVPQKATHIDAYFPASVAEVVGMALLAGGRPARLPGREARQRVREALEIVGLAEFSRAAIGRLSGGQQQRVFIARALVTRPRILFLDEPTTGVDAETQTAFYDLLGRLNRSRNLTIVLVTHDIGVVNRHVNRVACVNQRLVYHGDHEGFCRSDAFREMIGHGNHLVSHEH